MDGPLEEIEQNSLISIFSVEGLPPISSEGPSIQLKFLQLMLAILDQGVWMLVSAENAFVYIWGLHELPSKPIGYFPSSVITKIICHEILLKASIFFHIALLLPNSNDTAF